MIIGVCDDDAHDLVIVVLHQQPTHTHTPARPPAPRPAPQPLLTAAAPPAVGSIRHVRRVHREQWRTYQESCMLQM
jgi:hypothetical protein